MNTTVRELVVRNRSCRRFEESVPVERQTLEELVDLARLSASAANLQPLKYILSCKAEMNARIFPYLAWAGYLKDWPGPSEGERPTAYIVVLNDTEISPSPGCDHGIAAQSILLGAVEKGLAGCMIGLIRRPELRQALEIPERYEILLVIALGQPREKAVIGAVGPDREIKYYRDEAGTHHVPKRALTDVILP
jgi:nitroreductase